MAEPIVEQISQWIASALDSVQDPDTTLTISAKRPKISAWDVTNYTHGDVIIEIVSTRTTENTVSTRQETGTWKLYGIVSTIPDGTQLDTVMARLAETIRRTLLAGNVNGKACSGLGTFIDCAEVMYSVAEGCAVVEVTCEVDYWTEGLDGYA